MRILPLVTSLLLLAPDFGGGAPNIGRASNMADLLSAALSGRSGNDAAILDALRGSDVLGGRGNLSMASGDRVSMSGADVRALVNEAVADAVKDLVSIGAVAQAMPIRTGSQDIDNASESLSLTGTFRQRMRVRLIVSFTGPTTVQVNQRSIAKSISATLDGGALWSSQSLGFTPIGPGCFECWADLDRDGTTLVFSLSCGYVASDSGVLVAQVYAPPAVDRFTGPVT